MSKFKYGDKVKLKSGVRGWDIRLHDMIFTVSDDPIYGGTDSVVQCVINYGSDFELVEHAPKKHVHHDMIVEWAKDPSRVVECKAPDNDAWTVLNHPSWHTDVQYRFRPERVFPETSLTDDEIKNIVLNSQHMDKFRNIANAAIKQYILDQENS